MKYGVNVDTNRCSCTTCLRRCFWRRFSDESAEELPFHEDNENEDQSSIDNQDFSDSGDPDFDNDANDILSVNLHGLATVNIPMLSPSNLLRSQQAIAILTVYKQVSWYLNFANHRTKESFVSTANKPLVGTLMTIGDGTVSIAIAKILVYKHCFCYLNAENLKQKNSLFRQPIALWLAH